MDSMIDKKPKTIVFPSYTVDDLSKIVQQRCALCNEALHTSLVLFSPTAIELCAKKVVIEYPCFEF